MQQAISYQPFDFYSIIQEFGQLTWGNADFFYQNRGTLFKFGPPSPIPEFLTNDFPSADRSRTEILTNENLVGARTAPTSVSKTFTPLVARRTTFP